MDFKKILSKIKNYEIKIRKAVNSQMRGSFSSLFKGSGLEFEDVREYQYGDDVRHIDWNVSAKGEGAYVKVFKEEKEQTIFFLLDVSKSQEIGLASQQKIDIAKEITSVLALSAIKEGSEVGLICFSDQKEKYVKPDKGMKKAYEIMLSLYKLEPKSTHTDLNAMIHFAMNVIKRRSIVILISDFIDENYYQGLKSMAKAQDLILLHIIDKSEIEIPKLGIIPLVDKESKHTVWINSSSKKFREEVKEKFLQNEAELESLVQHYRSNYVPIHTDEDFVPTLIRLFKIRNKKSK